MTDRVNVGLALRDHPELVQRGDHGLARLGHRQAGEPLAGGGVHAPVLADHGDLLESVPPADLEVVGVVAGRDLERTRAELGVHEVVRDDGQPPAHDRQDRGLADQVRVTLVAGAHGHGDVRQHRLGAHRGHGEASIPTLEPVVDVVEGVLDVAVLHLEV